MEVITTETQPIKNWAKGIEAGALEQAKHLANLPFTVGCVALMPDAHQGYGMPIGGVLATNGTVVPNAVGVDIGCGMMATRTEIKAEGFPTKEVMGRIRELVPIGFSHHAKEQDRALMPVLDCEKDYEVCVKEYKNALTQIGTLGGGNHFIEIQKDSKGCVWIMIHSGSRNLGKQVADHYSKLAIDLNEKYHSRVPREWDLAFLPIDSDEGQCYLNEMSYCVEFAFANRQLMMDNCLNVMLDVAANGRVELVAQKINIAHNYAVMENHYGKNVMVHRKGATLARKGTVGIIPGSQGTKSYIVRGLGNKDSMDSCSHGAGRRMGRKEASRTLDLEATIKDLDERGIVHSIRNVKDLDEAPGAYKDIDEVMANQKDLVEIVEELTPMGVVKG